MSSPIDRTCHYHFKKGWWCSRDFMHTGPCALRPTWWNMNKDAREYRKFERNFSK